MTFVTAVSEDRFDVSLQTPGGKKGPFPSPMGNNERSSESSTEFNYHHNTGKYPPRRPKPAGERVDGSHDPPR